MRRRRSWFFTYARAVRTEASSASGKFTWLAPVEIGRMLGHAARTQAACSSCDSSAVEAPANPVTYLASRNLFDRAGTGDDAEIAEVVDGPADRRSK